LPLYAPAFPPAILVGLFRLADGFAFAAALPFRGFLLGGLCLAFLLLLLRRFELLPVVPVIGGDLLIRDGDGLLEVLHAGQGVLELDPLRSLVAGRAGAQVGLEVLVFLVEGAHLLLRGVHLRNEQVGFQLHQAGLGLAVSVLVAQPQLRLPHVRGLLPVVGQSQYLVQVRDPAPQFAVLRRQPGEGEEHLQVIRRHLHAGGLRLPQEHQVAPRGVRRHPSHASVPRLTTEQELPEPGVRPQEAVAQALLQLHRGGVQVPGSDRFPADLTERGRGARHEEPEGRQRPPGNHDHPDQHRHDDLLVTSEPAHHHRSFTSSGASGAVHTPQPRNHN